MGKIICKYGCKNYKKLKGIFRVFNPSSRHGKAKEFRPFGVICRKGEKIEEVIEREWCTEHTKQKYHLRTA